MMLCFCSCGKTEIPAAAELNGHGTFEAQTEWGTYSGRFAVDGPAFTVQIGEDTAPILTFICNGPGYVVQNGTHEQTCTPADFPEGSLWRILPELLRAQWTDPTGWIRSGTQICRDFPDGYRMEWSDEKNAVLYFPDEKGQATLHYTEKGFL
jgi:hypothetical protein